MKQKVLIIFTLCCAFSVRASPTIDIQQILGPIIKVKTGAIGGVQKGFNAKFGLINGVLNSLGSIGGGHGSGGHGSGGHGSGHSDSSSSDFDSSDSGFSSGGTQYSGDSGYSYQPPPPPPVYSAPAPVYSAPAPVYSAPAPVYSAPQQSYGPPQQSYGPPQQDSGYHYDRPSSSGHDASSHGSSHSSSSSSSFSEDSDFDSDSSSGGGATSSGLGGIFGSIGKIPVAILTQKKSLINNILDKKIGIFSKIGGGHSQ